MNKLPLWEQGMIALCWLVLLGGVMLLTVDGSGITSMSVKEVTIQPIQKTMTGTDAVVIEPTHPITSLKLFGVIEGTGNVWLVNDKDERLLVFSNAGSGLASITGFATLGTDIPSGTTIIDNACLQTCFIADDFAASRYQLITEPDDGSSITLDRMVFE